MIRHVVTVAMAATETGSFLRVSYLTPLHQLVNYRCQRVGLEAQRE
jgi:hypothetical protein